VELDPGFAEGILECGDELTAEHTTEHFDGKKKGVGGGDPASVVRSEAASGDYAVNMRMMLQSLIPGMEHAEEADLCAKVTGIAGDLQQGFGAGVKQQVVDQSLVLQCERSEFPWQGEDNVHVAGWAAVPVPVPGASAGARCPGTVGNAGCGTSYTRWQYVRSPSTDRDVHPARRCGSV
jgi:hypothetical protein